MKIKLRGKERNFKYGIQSTGKILKHLDCSISDLGKEMTSNPFLVYPVIVFYGLEQGDKDFDNTFDEVCEWVEDDGIMGESVLKAVSLFAENLSSLLPKQEEVKEVAKKKKLTGK